MINSSFVSDGITHLYFHTSLSLVSTLDRFESKQTFPVVSLLPSLEKQADVVGMCVGFHNTWSKTQWP